MTISQETKDLILEIANKQMQTNESTKAISILNEMLTNKIEKKKSLPKEFVDISYNRMERIIASVLAEAHRIGNLVADTTVTTTTIYHKKLD